MLTREEKLTLLAEADRAGIETESPKAFVTYLLQAGKKDSVLAFYKPGTAEFDFDAYRGMLAELKKT